MNFARPPFFFALSFGLGELLTACLDRPVVEASPKTSNIFVAQVAQAEVKKMDLLFMIDNSASMSDKQDILRDAVPVLVTRLTSPWCVDPLTQVPNGETSSHGKCAKGEPEFNAVNDIHVGIVTSSLGDHGGTLCSVATVVNPNPNDRAHLLGTVRPAGSSDDPSRVFDVAKTWNNTGFLAWDANGTHQPVPGSTDPATFQTAFQSMVVAAGEQGCGFEASLESWYRFLIDPEPPKQVTRSAEERPKTVRGSALVNNPDGSTTCVGCDLELLAQRKAFLRPDSLVAIIMLSDENDCSVRDDGVGWLVGTGGVSMPRATTACATNPNDPCCRSCADPARPAPGCPVTAEDAVCKAAPVWTDREESTALRCFNQKRRFGVDLLYPTSRYVDALTKSKLTLQSDAKTQVDNPLFAPDPKTGKRDTSRVFLAGIVGVPWQDIADEASLMPGSDRLAFLSADELVRKNRWSVLVGDPEASPPKPPGDPFMVEASGPRTGANPITADAITPETSMDPRANRINGHEQRIPALPDDLQYACTFPIKPKTCKLNENACDCSPRSPNGTANVVAANSPLCQPPGGGPADATQFYAKAYPGTRELEVLKGLGEQGIAASICPKHTESANPDSDPNYGYNPAVAAIVTRLKAALTGKCLPRVIEADPVTHQVQCKVVEAQTSGCDCKLEGRGAVDPVLQDAAQKQLAAIGRCGRADQPACSSFCQCEILQEQGPSLDACRNGEQTTAGFCYIDAPGSPLLKSCPANEKRLLRFVSRLEDPTTTPASGAITVVACLGAPLGT